MKTKEVSTAIISTEINSRAKPMLWNPEAPDSTTSIERLVLVDSSESGVSSPTSGSVVKQKRRKNGSPTITNDVSETDAIPDRTRYSPTIKEMPRDERPRERLYKYGEQVLSTAELVAIIIQSGTAERSSLSLAEHLLAHFGSIKGIACATVEQLREFKGVGSAKAAQIKAAIAFGHRLALFVDDAGPKIGSPVDAYNLLMPELRYLKKEVFKSLLLDAKNRVMSARTVSVGDLTSSIVNPREVFKDAVIASAASIVVAHNHPSGDPTPSPEDVSVTKRLMEAGRILEIEVLDHIVIGDGTFVSLKERGLI